LGLCSRGRNFGPSSDVADFGATARFFRTCHEGQECTSHLLRDLISASRLRTEFSTQPVRKLLSRTSIWPGDPEFRPMVSGTITGPGANFSRGNLAGSRSLRRLSARPAHMVDLGNYRHDSFLG
jgi:hypothetical protein